MIGLIRNRFIFQLFSVVKMDLHANQMTASVNISFSPNNLSA